MNSKPARWWHTALGRPIFSEKLLLDVFYRGGLAIYIYIYIYIYSAPVTPVTPEQARALGVGA